VSSPEFGPRGYLPPKAAKRARKIVLREQMGMGWPLAAAAAAVLVALAGVAYFLFVMRAPGPPYVDLGAVEQVPATGSAELTSAPAGATALVVRSAGAVRAFAAQPPGVAWCAQSRRLETADAAWAADGRLVHGDGQSLQPRRVVVHDGRVYVDVRTQLPRPAPAPGGPPPACEGTD